MLELKRSLWWKILWSDCKIKSQRTTISMFKAWSDFMTRCIGINIICLIFTIQAYVRWCQFRKCKFFIIYKDKVKAWSFSYQMSWRRQRCCIITSITQTKMHKTSAVAVNFYYFSSYLQRFFFQKNNNTLSWLIATKTMLEQ